MIAAIRHTILILVGERTVENLTVVDDAIVVAVGGPFDHEAGNKICVTLRTIVIPTTPAAIS